MRKRNTLLGGEVIDTGGFGCVFKPALRCKNTKIRYKGISKLQKIDDARTEFNIVQLALQYIKQIPNYHKYFLIDNFNYCNPAKLTIKDKKHFYKCDIFQDLNINDKNININLDKFRIINMPYGGISLDKIITDNIESFSVIDTLLQNLLVNAIIPMNRLNLYHTDLKATNLLYINISIKIIDFGLLVIKDSNNEYIIKLSKRSINYNCPLSIILLSSSFDKFLMIYLTNYPLKNTDNLYSIYLILISEYYKEYKKLHTNNHADYISNDIIPIINNILQYPNIDFEYIISTYCAKILLKYVNYETKTFNRQLYIKEVYIKNIDIYGFIMCYLPYIYTNIVHSEKIKIAKMIYKFCFGEDYADKPIIF